MKLHKVALWNKRERYYVLNSKYVLYIASHYGLRVSHLGLGESLQASIKDCSLVQKQ